MIYILECPKPSYVQKVWDGVGRCGTVKNFYGTAIGRLWDGRVYFCRQTFCYGTAIGRPGRL